MNFLNSELIGGSECGLHVGYLLKLFSLKLRRLLPNACLHGIIRHLAARVGARGWVLSCTSKAVQHRFELIFNFRDSNIHVLCRHE